ncbi:MAG: hypothetical protein KJ905_02815 [Nanoarchaeota archaeon]|nr:hypothetical protein [Nanoarchaeota archaeon]MBU1501681.1 hypothetical protein [Nanoarchaeota archaeon]MBU2458765.1 hypothetical protein [Nanoarchaeota archaeon]
MMIKELLHELKHHAPFTIAATIIAIGIALVVEYYFKSNISENLFEILHPLHIIASAMVTTRIFYKYKPKLIPALLVGISGAIIIGSLSDVILPWMGGNLFNLKTIFHLPIIEAPTLILASALIGSLVGATTKITKMSHFAHVGLSVFASLFYLMAFSATFSAIYLIGVIVIVIVAVIIPCCVSDILYPFFFLGKKIKHCNC